MRIAVIDESRARATIIEEGLRAFEGSEIFVFSEREALLSRIAEIEPDIVLMDLGNPARDVLEEYFAVSRALSRPIAMFVDQSDDGMTKAAIAQLRYRGVGPKFYRLSAKTILYKRSEVVAWMESRACTRTDDVLASN